jgi:hypothetical protein
VLKHIFGTRVVGTGAQTSTQQAKALLEVDDVLIGESIIADKTTNRASLYRPSVPISKHQSSRE